MTSVGTKENLSVAEHSLMPALPLVIFLLRGQGAVLTPQAGLHKVVVLQNSPELSPKLGQSSSVPHQETTLSLLCLLS